jgi:hypothetical protein
MWKGEGARLTSQVSFSVSFNLSMFKYLVVPHFLCLFISKIYYEFLAMITHVI